MASIAQLKGDEYSLFTNMSFNKTAYLAPDEAAQFANTEPADIIFSSREVVKYTGPLSDVHQSIRTNECALSGGFILDISVINDVILRKGC